MMSESTIEKLAMAYFEKTGTSPEYSFWAWLSAIGVNPTEEELKKVLNEIDLYEF